MAKRDYEISLVQIAQKTVLDVYGYITDEFGDPTFKLTRLEFTDGTILDIEGEHDLPYLITDGVIELPEDDA